VNVQQAKALVEKAQNKKLVLTVGHSERFSPVFSELRKHAQRPQYLEFSRRAPHNARGGDVSVIHDLMIHDLDLLLSIDKSQIRLVSAQAGKMVTGTFDWASAAFEFSSGLKAIIHCSRINPVMERTVRWIDQAQEIIGDFNKGELLISRWNSQENKMNFETLAVGRGDNLYSETENFVAAIHGQVPATVPGADGLRALELAEEINTLVQSRRLY
jgi:predicted dehydrogenase